MLAILIVGAGAVGGYLALGRDATLSVFTIEASGAVAGFNAGLAIDDDPTTAWRPPNQTGTHKITVDFGRAVDLETIILATGADPGGTRNLADAQPLTGVALRFSNGTTADVPLNPQLSDHEVPINLRVNWIEFSLPQGATNIVIRELDFIGTVP